MFKQKVIFLFSDTPSVKNSHRLITDNEKNKRKNPIPNGRQIYTYGRQQYEKRLKIALYKAENENLQWQTDRVIYDDRQRFFL